MNMTYCCPLGIHYSTVLWKALWNLKLYILMKLQLTIICYLEIWNSYPSPLHTQIHKKPHFKFHLSICLFSSNIWKDEGSIFPPNSTILRRPKFGMEFLNVLKMRQRIHLGQLYGVSFRAECHCFPLNMGCTGFLADLYAYAVL